MPFLLPVYAFALGAIVGSFLNVVIHRYPREESIVFPPSHCPDCRAAIRPWDNIPLLSYIVLLGRCRSCRGAISPRYPLVELANALFYLAIFQRTGLSAGFVLVAAFVSVTIALIYIDAEIQMLPDVMTYPAIAVGLLTGWLRLGGLENSLMLSASLADAAIGAALGALIVIAIILTYWLVRRVEGMGWGDVKMLAMIGATLGWRSVPAVLLLASISGALVGIPLALQSEKRMQMALPFGVFLGFATLLVLFFGNTLFAWWVTLAGL
jgi:leader peptidase (prepilin peptidase)/N-methyltransferase